MIIIETFFFSNKTEILELRSSKMAWWKRCSKHEVLTLYMGVFLNFLQAGPPRELLTRGYEDQYQTSSFGALVQACIKAVNNRF